jgi:hypothetical protein
LGTKIVPKSSSSAPGTPALPHGSRQHRFQPRQAETRGLDLVEEQEKDINCGYTLRMQQFEKHPLNYNKTLEDYLSAIKLQKEVGILSYLRKNELEEEKSGDSVKSVPRC